MESCLSHKQRIIRADRHVLWTNNSPATFQALMDNIFNDLIKEGKIVVYMDDILVFSSTLLEHRAIMRDVLLRLRNNKLYLKLE